MMLDWALTYIGRGWPVIPLHSPASGGCSCGDASCAKIGKHPRTRHGLTDASTDSGQIREWWTRWPDANIGICTGSKSGLLVIDLDNKAGISGEDNFRQLAARFGGLPDTPMA